MSFLSHAFSQIANTARSLTGNALGIPGLDPALFRGDFGHMAPVTRAAALAGGILLGGQALAGPAGNSAAFGTVASGPIDMSTAPNITDVTLGGPASVIGSGGGPASISPMSVAGTSGAGSLADAFSAVSLSPEAATTGFDTAMDFSGSGGLNPRLATSFAPQMDFSSGFGPVGAGDVGTGYSSYAEPSFWSRFQGNPWLKAMSYGSGAIGVLGGIESLKRPAVYDPFAGQRGQYQEQLSRLASDPSYITQLPGYQAGLQAIERSMAANGYLGSGNMMLALQDYGGKAYSDEFARLSSLAGAGISPMPDNSRAQGLEMLSRGLASIGFGAAL